MNVKKVAVAEVAEVAEFENISIKRGYDKSRGCEDCRGFRV